MHPISGSISFSLGKPYAAVTVMRKGKQLIIQPGDVFIAKSNVRFAEIPDEYEVVDQEGNRISADGKFLISVETFDPFHAVVDFR